MFSDLFSCNKTARLTSNYEIKSMKWSYNQLASNAIVADIPCINNKYMRLNTTKFNEMVI